MPDKPKDIAPLSSDTNPYIRKIDTYLGSTRFLNLKEILTPADNHNFGVLAANAVVPDMLFAVLDAAFESNSPLIIEFAESQLKYALSGSNYKDKLTRSMDLAIDEVVKRVKQYKRIPPNKRFSTLVNWNINFGLVIISQHLQHKSLLNSYLT